MSGRAAHIHMIHPSPDESRPASRLDPCDSDAQAIRKVFQHRSPRAVSDRQSGKHSPRTWLTPGEHLGQPSVVRCADVNHHSLRLSDRVPELAVGIDQQQHLAGLAFHHQQRRHRQPRPVAGVARGDDGHRRGKPPAKTTQRIPVFGIRHERMIGVNRHRVETKPPQKSRCARRGVPNLGQCGCASLSRSDTRRTDGSTRDC